MGSSSSKPTPGLSENELAMARERKLNDLMVQWYQVVLQVPPPPFNDPNLLSYESRVNYHYTSIISAGGSGWNGISATINNPRWVVHSTAPRISVDRAAVDRTITSALENTTKSQTGEGYGTCVIQSFQGTYNDEPCLFKVIVVAVSFNFSASEYKTDQDVAAFGYWVYFFRAALPFRNNDQEPSSANPLAYTVPNDINIVGRKYMTVAELDRFNP